MTKDNPEESIAEGGRFSKRLREVLAKPVVGALLLVWVSIVSIGTGFGLVQNKAAIERINRDERREAAEELIEQADACVRRWDRYHEVRNLVVNGIVESNRSLIQNLVAFVVANPSDPNEPPPDPERLERAVEFIVSGAERDAEAVADQYPEPDCNQKNAREVIERGLPE